MTEGGAYRVKRWVGFDSPSVSPVPKGPELFEKVRAATETYVRFGESWALDIYALSVLQAYVARDLEAVFYVLFSETKGRGKTIALDLWSELTGGLNASDISAAALVHYLSENPNGAVAVDEADVRRDAERDAAIAAILRNGYTRGKPYLRWDPTTRQLDPCETYGAKAIGFRDKVDDALEDRGFILPTGTVTGREGARFVLRNLRRETGDLPKQLAAWGRSPHRREAIAAEMSGDLFVRMVEQVVGAESIGANRETQLTAIALAVCRGACIDLTDSIRSAFDVRREVATANVDVDLDEAREILEEMGARAGLLTRETPLRVIRQSDFARALNARRDERGLRAITSTELARLRNDLGIRPRWLTHPKNKCTWNIPAQEWDGLLGRVVANLPNPPNPTVKDGEVSQVRQVNQGGAAPDSNPAELGSWLEPPAPGLAPQRRETNDQP